MAYFIWFFVVVFVVSKGGMSWVVLAGGLALVFVAGRTRIIPRLRRHLKKLSRQRQAEKTGLDGELKIKASSARVDDRRVISGIIFVIRNGLRWRDAPKEYGPHKTIYNRFIRWSRLGVFNRILAELAAGGGKPNQLMIDATHLKAHRTAASLLKKGLYPDVSDAPRAA